MVTKKQASGNTATTSNKSTDLEDLPKNIVGHTIDELRQLAAKYYQKLHKGKSISNLAKYCDSNFLNAAKV
jgi:hypothetical protein